jgi:hypothetical protein
MNRFQKIAFACVAVAVGAVNAHAQLIASFTPASPFLAALPGGATFGGQTFTAQIDANVGVVSLLAQRIGAAPSSVTFQLRTVSGGLPTGSILGDVTVPGSGLGASLQSFSADFSSLNIAVTAGQSYALVISAPSLFALGGVADAYAGGAQIFSNNSGATFGIFPPPRDLTFSVAAAAVAIPEPAVYPFGGIVVLLAIWGRSRFRRDRAA